jgi:hypothetical protein
MCVFAWAHHCCARLIIYVNFYFQTIQAVSGLHSLDFFSTTFNRFALLLPFAARNYTLMYDKMSKSRARGEEFHICDEARSKKR